MNDIFIIYFKSFDRINKTIQIDTQDNIYCTYVLEVVKKLVILYIGKMPVK